MTHHTDSFRALTRFATTLGALAFVAGCSQAGNSPVSPSRSGLSSESTNAAGGTPTVRYYRAAISPTSVTSGSSTSFTVTVTNDPTTSLHQTMKSATIAVPTGFTVTPSFSVSVTGWTASLVSGTIQLAKTGSNEVAPGESVSVTFNATAPTLALCDRQTYTWTTVGYNGSDFTTPYVLKGSQPQVTVIADCPEVTSCTFGQGYWKNHHANWPASVLLNGLMLGTVTYTPAQLDLIYDEPVVGNGLVSLAHHLITAKINVANGADPSAIAATIAAADAMIGGLSVPPVGSGSLSTSSVSALTSALEDYNEGRTGPGACSASS